MKLSRHNSMSYVRGLLSTALEDPVSVTKLENPDLDLLIRLLRRVRLHGRLAAELKLSGKFSELPDVAQDQLESALVTAEARARIAMWELNRLEWATRDQPGLELICMKGCTYILLDTPNARGRIFADVDLLLSRDKIDAVEQLLNRRGWQTQTLSAYDDNYYRRWTHELPPLTHLERDVEVDLHHNILPGTARLKPDARKLVEQSQVVSGQSIRVLCDVDSVLHAAVHLMFDSDLADKLRDLVDIRDICRHFAGQSDDFWDRLVSRAEELGLGRPLYYCLRYCAVLLDFEIPNFVAIQSRRWAPLPPVLWLMDSLVPRALLPELGAHPSKRTALARFVLYMRSHWLRMPPALLAYHLLNKYWRTKTGG